MRYRLQQAYRRGRREGSRTMGGAPFCHPSCDTFPPTLGAHPTAGQLTSIPSSFPCGTAPSLLSPWGHLLSYGCFHFPSHRCILGAITYLFLSLGIYHKAWHAEAVWLETELNMSLAFSISEEIMIPEFRINEG